jgi:spore maturation protein CgeB
MDEAAEITLSDQVTPYINAFVTALNHQVSKQAGIDPEKIDFISALDDLETYIRGKDRIELVNAITEAKVDIFGSSQHIETWTKYFGKKRSNIVIHDPVPYEQVLDIMKHTKIILNSSPWIKNGAHERIFSGLACGALVLTNENIYMREHFTDGEDILFYQHKKWDKANHKINDYLGNEAKRERVAAKGREKVMAEHTWDHRAATLIAEVEKILPRLRDHSKSSS